jgi:hypothetical protein
LQSFAQQMFKTKISLAFYLPGLMRVQRCCFLVGWLHETLLNCKRVVYKLTPATIKVLLRNALSTPGNSPLFALWFLFPPLLWLRAINPTLLKPMSIFSPHLT